MDRQQDIRRPRVARVYAVLIALATLMVVVQAFLFAAFYSEGDKEFIDVHARVADISLLVVVLIVTPLAFLARFRRDRRIGWLTLVLAVLWFVQHSLRFGIEDERWLEMIHIPLGLVIFGLALYLTGRTYTALWRRVN